METHARYATIGMFALAVIAAALGFVYWLSGPGGLERAVYRIRFEGPVNGLLPGSPVLFNGVRIGEVTDIDSTRMTLTGRMCSHPSNAPPR